jgi:pimeloyl-ACP methyl ester carboxylesterase
VLVDIGSHSLHLRCVGPWTSKPIVILEAGADGLASNWSGVQGLMASRVTTCSYDRAGAGWSDPGPVPRTMLQEVFELHTLLEVAHVIGPLVLVGESTGALRSRLHAERYGRDVAGLVLVNPTHENGMQFSARDGRWVRVREQATDRPVPEPHRDGRLGPPSTPENDYLAEELRQMYLSRRTNPVPLGDRPLIVLSTGEQDAQIIDLTILSRNSRFVRASSDGREMTSDNAPAIVRAIDEVVGAATKGHHLIP